MFHGTNHIFLCSAFFFIVSDGLKFLGLQYMDCSFSYFLCQMMANYFLSHFVNFVCIIDFLHAHAG